MKIVIIDGQGGKIGQILTEKLKQKVPEYELIAIGTNCMATTAMLRAGADFGATGENPIVYNCKDADIIIGPLGIVVANSFLGEITPKMALAIGESRAQKFLIPINKCNNRIVGMMDLSFSEYVDLAISEVQSYLNRKSI